MCELPKFVCIRSRRRPTSLQKLRADLQTYRLTELFKELHVEAKTHRKAPYVPAYGAYGAYADIFSIFHGKKSFQDKFLYIIKISYKLSFCLIVGQIEWSLYSK